GLPHARVLGGDAFIDDGIGEGSRRNTNVTDAWNSGDVAQRDKRHVRLDQVGVLTCDRGTECAQRAADSGRVADTRDLHAYAFAGAGHIVLTRDAQTFSDA